MVMKVVENTLMNFVSFNYSKMKKEMEKDEWMVKNCIEDTMVISVWARRISRRQFTLDM